MGSLLVKAIITVLQMHAKVDDKHTIRFVEPSLDNKVTVGDIKNHYSNLLDTWFHKYPENLVETMLVAGSPCGLDWYARKLLSQKVKAPLVMGHTHHGEQDPKSATGYGNDGCWCQTGTTTGGGQATYVEIVGNQARLCTLAATSELGASM